MQFEVVVTVKTTGTFSDTMRSIRQEWTFGDNQQWRLAGEAYVVEETAALLSKHIRDELKGSESANLNGNSGNPQKA